MMLTQRESYSPMPSSIFSVAQVRALELDLMRSQNLSEYELMQRVAAAMWQHILQHWPAVQHLVVCCGPGNNGGDGYVIATLAKQLGKRVDVITAVDVDSLAGTARLAAQAALQAQVDIRLWSGSLPIAELYIDALFGIGLQRQIDASYQSIIQSLNQSVTPIVSIDVPSGVHADTGVVLGVAVKACLTLTALALKIGLFMGDALDCVGQLQLVAGDLVQKNIEALLPLAKRFVREDFLQWPPRSRNSHKGLFGHVMIVGGDFGMGGAVILAAEAALRAGAGLVTVVTRHDHVSALLARLPEVMTVACEDAEQLRIILSRATVVVIGPGLGFGQWGKKLLIQTLCCPIPLVVDADALNWLAIIKDELNDASSKQGAVQRAWVMTPHPKEAARLLQEEVFAIQRDRIAAVQQLAASFQSVVVLKGAGTLVAAPSSDSEVLPLQLIDCGNSGMSVAGMGDVLSGIIAALIAQGFALSSAAAIGAWLHSTTGDQVVTQQGVRGMRATDLIAHLPSVMRDQLQKY